MSVHPAAEGLAGSLLYEGYALYPYTPAATKNATPTPFGIAYPPAYARLGRGTFDHSQVECVLLAEPDAAIEARSLFLVPSGPRHQASQRRVELGPLTLEELVGDPAEERFAFDRVTGRLALAAESLGRAVSRITLRVENLTALETADAEAMERPGALERSLLSVQLLAGVENGRFVSPLEREGELGVAVSGCRNSNSWPVLAAPEDEAVLGAPIVLPDHPELAPESRVDLFDNTEIEEALLLHVHVLSDSDREQVAAQDPAIREMIERATATTPEEILALHGRTELREPSAGHPVPGEREVSVGGATLRRGGRVVLRPTDRDPYDAMLAGRTATIERIFVDYDGTARLGVTVEGDPAQELFRDTGRYLFFRAEEVEPL